MKNFLYNKSDIIVAVIIVAIAAVIIWFRVDAIMEYPSSGSPSSEIGSTSNVADGGSDTEGDLATPPAITESAIEEPIIEEPVSQPEPEPVVTEPTPPPSAAPVQFEIKPGEAGSTIANNLVAAGLVPSASEFLDAANASGAMTRLKAGTFEIPGNSSVEQVIQILTR